MIQEILIKKLSKVLLNPNYVPTVTYLMYMIGTPKINFSSLKKMSAM